MLREQYIDFLIRTDDIMDAIYQLGIWRTGFNYFQAVAKMRMKSQVERTIERLEANNQFTLEYQLALDYD